MVKIASNKSIGYRAFNVINIVFFAILSLVMLMPFVNVLTLSLEPEYIASQAGVIHLFPRAITIKAYKTVFSQFAINQAFLNSSFVTIVGAIIGVVLTGMLAYGITDDKMMGNRVISFMILFTMMFKGGTIPSYILIKQLGLINSLWSLILPAVLTGYNVILMRVFFKNLPESLSESAKLDGCSEVGIFFRIILPLSTPIIATIFLFIAVGRWNSFFDVVMYINKPEKKTLQVLLRELLIIREDVDIASGDLDLGENIRMAVVIVTITPILIFYPFLQKHFTKGILIGAVKG